MSKQPPKIYTLYTEDLISLTADTTESLEVAMAMLRHELETEDMIQRKHIVSMLSEVVWICHTILLTLRKNMDEPVFKDDTQKEVIVLEDTLKTLKMLSSSKLSAVKELNSYSRSLALH